MVGVTKERRKGNGFSTFQRGKKRPLCLAKHFDAWQSTIDAWQSNFSASFAWFILYGELNLIECIPED